MRRFGLVIMAFWLAVLPDSRLSRMTRMIWTVWKEFVAALKAGTLTVDRIRSLYGTDRELHLKWLNELMKATRDNGACRIGTLRRSSRSGTWSISWSSSGSAAKRRPSDPCPSSRKEAAGISGTWKTS